MNRQRFQHVVPWLVAWGGSWGMILLGLLAANVFNALSIILLARRVTPLEYGQYIATFNLVLLTFVLPGFGLASWVLAQADAAHRFGRRLWYAALAPRVPGVVLWIGLFFIAGGFLSQETYPMGIMAPVLFTVLGDNILLFGYSFLRARNQHRMVTVFQAAAGLSLLALVLIAPIAPGRLWLFAVGRMCIVALAAGALAWYIHRKSPPWENEQGSPETGSLKIGGGIAAPRPPRGGVREAGPFFLADAAGIVYLKADITIVGVVIGALGAGIYGPASNILSMTFLVSQALFFFAVPRLSLQHQQEQGEFQRSATQQLLLQLATGAAVSAGLFVTAPYLVLWLFGPDYADSIPLLRLFSLIPILRSVTFGLAAILIATQRQPERTVVQIITAVISVVGSLLVIETYGLPGVAWVFVGTEAVVVLGYLYLVAGGRLSRKIAPVREVAA